MWQIRTLPIWFVANHAAAGFTDAPSLSGLRGVSGLIGGHRTGVRFAPCHWSQPDSNSRVRRVPRKYDWQQIG